VKWEAIDCAPKDGTRILVYGPAGIHIASWKDEIEWISWEVGSAWLVWQCEDVYYTEVLAGDYEPTHWRPLPPPPM
jgi:hypothetical protein